MTIPRWRLALTAGALVILAAFGGGAAAAAVTSPGTAAGAPAPAAAPVATTDTNSAPFDLTALAGSATANTAGTPAQLGRLRVRLDRWADMAGRRLVHGTLTVLDKSGNPIQLQLDHGTVATVGTGTITISEQVERTSWLRRTRDTHVRKARKPATLGDLKVGDEVVVEIDRFRYHGDRAPDRRSAGAAGGRGTGQPRQQLIDRPDNVRSGGGPPPRGVGPPSHHVRVQTNLGWRLDPSVTFLNHGSFGACPAAGARPQQALRDADGVGAGPLPASRIARLLDAAPDRGRAVPARGPRRPGLRGECDHRRQYGPPLLRFKSGRRTPRQPTTVQRHAQRDARRSPRPRRGAGRRGRDPVSDRGSGGSLEAILGAVTPRTRLVVVSQVTSPTALVLPVAGYSSPTLIARGIDTLVDGAHAPGMIPLDLDGLGAAYWTGTATSGCAARRARRPVGPADRREAIHPLVVSHGANSPTYRPAPGSARIRLDRDIRSVGLPDAPGRDRLDGSSFRPGRRRVRRPYGREPRPGHRRSRRPGGRTRDRRAGSGLDARVDGLAPA